MMVAIKTLLNKHNIIITTPNIHTRLPSYTSILSKNSIINKHQNFNFSELINNTSNDTTTTIHKQLLTDNFTRIRKKKNKKQKT